MTNSTQANGRTHEPDLREVVMQIDDIKELFNSQVEAIRKIMDERDRLYAERAESQVKAIEAALHASERQTALSFAASEKAITKAENAQQQYNERSNEFRSALDDAQKNSMSRNEANAEFNRVAERFADIKKELAAHKDDNVGQIAQLREWKSSTAGHSQGTLTVLIVTSVIVLIIGVLIGMGFHVMMMARS